ncbi:helix-turn-helix domain-containing protein [Aneurinibacillus sp. BA2021]|nr:helix-turn-helix domain-containing protein [Aneurinibacillus sp. BA2021]
MNTRFEEGLFLVSAARFQGERTSQAIVHLLRGRQNNQVVADAALFGTSMLYGVMRELPVEEVRRKLDRLIERGWIRVPSDAKEGVFCSDAGKAELAACEALFRYEACLSAVASVHEKARAVRFWKKLSLLVQTTSYLAAGETLFYPVIEHRELQQEVKRVIKSIGDPPRLAVRLKEELARWMRELTEEEQQLILRRLSGKARAGWTYRQLADASHTAEGAAALHLLRLAAEQLERIEAGPYPLLRQIAEQNAKEAGLTRTAQQTKALLDQGCSFEEIVRRRALRPGTIEDHLVEIAIADPAFDIQPFVSREKMERVHAIMRESGMKKIGEIRREAGESYSFLEIRLASVRAAQGGERP